MPLFANPPTDSAQTPPATLFSETTSSPDLVELTLLREAFDLATNAIALYQTLYNANGRAVNLQCVLANAPAVRYLGQPLDVLLGSPLLNDHPTEQQRRIASQMLAVVESGQPGRFEQYAESTGQWFDVSLVPRTGGLRLTSSDITIQKSQQQKLTNQASFYKAILNNVPAGISTLRPYRNSRGEIEDFIYVFINDYTSANGGRPAKRFMGNRLLQIMPHLRQNGTFDGLVAVMQTGQPQRFTLVEQRDGHAERGELSAAAHGDYLICSFTPISESAPVRPAPNDQ